MDVSTPQKLCECGCGRPVAREANRFIHGHNRSVANPVCTHGHGPLEIRTRNSRASGQSYHCRECDRIAQQRRRFERDYGITIEEYDALWLAQEGLCAICRQPETATRKGKAKALAVDHDHQTGQVRSLLCSRCNVAIGYLNDDPDLMRAAAVYIEEHRG